MEISFNNSVPGGIGRMHETFDASSVDAGQKTQAASRDTNVKGAEPSAVDVLQRSEPVSEVPEAALSRDDALGRLVNSAFSLPAPPMPEFT